MNTQTQTFRKPELLAPAGDPEKLSAALRFGADAVYAGGSRFGLRAAAGNFTIDQLKNACAQTHAAGKKIYLTLNAYLVPEDFPVLENFLEELRPLSTDAYIVSDPGLITTVRAMDPQRPLHLSTQANTLNAAAAAFWGSHGISRVNLGRELDLAQIAAIRRQCALELEVFVHGAMCVAYSGRCLLSAVLSARSANRGACAHPCRWSYALQEETRPGQYFPIEEDGRGTHILNSFDLCQIDHLPALAAAGVDSLKIEGRMKSACYAAVVTDVYRQALDAIAAQPEGFTPPAEWREELEKVSHRPYSTGFLFPDAGAQIHPASSSYIRSHDFIGVVNDTVGLCVQVRNRFFAGETLELVSPGLKRTAFTVENISTLYGERRTVAQPNELVRINLPPHGRAGDLLRRARS